jgi:hypothetical protein
MSRDGGDGSQPWRVVSLIAGGAVSVPVVVGFVALGAAVVALRSARDAAREVSGWLSVLRGDSRTRDDHSDAA